jgi:hypothetical protein
LSVLPRTSLIDVLDEACQQAIVAQRSGRRLSQMRLSPTMFRLVEQAKVRDRSFGNEVMLLGLPVIEAPELRTDQVELA